VANEAAKTSFQLKIFAWRPQLIGPDEGYREQMR